MTGMRIDVVTLFPGFFSGPLEQSILKRAQEKKLVQIRVHDLRAYTHDRHKTADDKPFGGGAGMVMKPEPVFECVEAIRPKGWVVLLDARGKTFTQKTAERLKKKKGLVLIAGHYEGVDFRVQQHLADEVISVGDYITTGGEAPALCVIEAVVRLIPGVLGNLESLRHESFHAGALEYPQYTRPRVYRGWKVPDVLVSGDHHKVAHWRQESAEMLTAKVRPDLKKSRPNVKMAGSRRQVK